MRLQGAAKGFTIIELLIVVIVIGILAAAGLAKYQNFAESSRRKTCLTQITTIEGAMGVWETTYQAFAENSKTGFGFTTRTGRLTGCGANLTAAMAVGPWAFAGGASDRIVSGDIGGTVGALADLGGQATVGGPTGFYNNGTAAAPTSGPLGRIIRDDKVWICPSALSRYYGGEVQNVPDDFMDVQGSGVPSHTGGLAAGRGGRYFYFVCGRGSGSAGVTALGNNGFDAGGDFYITNTAANGGSPQPQPPFKLAICGCYGTFGGTANSAQPGTQAMNEGGPVGPDGSALNRHSSRW